MTRIDFYFNANDRIRTACKVAAKAYRQKHRVVVCVTDTESARLIDHMLWSDEPTGFIPHCQSTHSLVMNTPVLITMRVEESAHDEVLINLTNSPPRVFGRFQRLIEIVSLDASDRDSARDRFRFYKDRGYEIHHHDLSARSHSAQ